MDKLTRYLGRLFILLLVASFVLALFDVQWQIVIAAFAIGLIGWVVTGVADSSRRSAAFYRAVEQHAAQHGLPYRSEDRRRRDYLQYAQIGGLLLLFVGSIVLNIMFNTFWFVCGFFALALVGMAAFGLRQQSRRNEMWQRFAARHGLTYKGSSISPRLEGHYQQRPLVMETFTTTRFSRHSGGSRRTTLYHIRIAVPVDNQAGCTLRWRKGRLESTPAPVAQDILEMTDLGQRLEAAAPDTFVLAESVLLLERQGVIAEEAELQFLVDLVCDTADAVEVLNAWQQPGGPAR